MHRCKLLFFSLSAFSSFPSALIILFVDESIFSISKSDVIITTHKKKRMTRREKKVRRRRLFHVNVMTQYFTALFHSRDLYTLLMSSFSCQTT